MCRAVSPAPTGASTITSVSTTATSICPSRRPSYQRASPTPVTQRGYALTPSAKSPFFMRLEEEHDASTASIDTDSALTRPERLLPSLHASTLSSESSSTLRRRFKQPRRPLSTPPQLQRAHRSTSHSVSATAWKQWSKRTCTNSDCESLLSEPASYSRSAYVANGMWIVQHDASTAEKEVTQRRIQRSAQRARKIHSLQTSFETRVKPRAYAYELYDEEADSSKLLSQFFSGQISPSVAPNNVRAMSEFERVAPGSKRMAAMATPAARAHTNDYYGDMGSNEHHYHHESTFGDRYRGLDPNSYFERTGEYGMKKEGTKRFSPRRLRWWFRKWTHKMRGQWEYNF